VVHQTVTRKPGQNPLSLNSTIEQMQGSRAELVLSRPTLAEVDGDILGETKHIELTVDRRALLVRVPTEPDLSATATIPPIKI
jgi:diacylglycerol kinase family enzyme